LAARLPTARHGPVSTGHLPPIQRHGTAPNRGGRHREKSRSCWSARRTRVWFRLTRDTSAPGEALRGSGRCVTLAPPDRDTPELLLELSVVEQRYQAVLGVIRDGVSIVEVAPPVRRAASAVHRWLRPCLQGEGPIAGPSLDAPADFGPSLTPCGRTPPRRGRLLPSPRWHTPWSAPAPRSTQRSAARNE
jgi:hypothetical protein